MHSVIPKSRQKVERGKIVDAPHKGIESLFIHPGYGFSRVFSVHKRVLKCKINKKSAKNLTRGVLMY